MTFSSLSKRIKSAACQFGGAAFVLIVILMATPLQALTAEQATSVIERAQDEAKSGQTARAIRRIEWLLLNDTEHPDRTETYQKILRILTNKAPLSFGLTGAMLPTTNLRHSSSEDVFETEIGDFFTEAPTSGLGIRATAASRYRYAYAAGRDITADFNLSSSYYDEAELRYSTQSLNLSHRWHLAGKRYTLTASANKFLYPNIEGRSAPDSWSRAISVSGIYTLKASQAFAFTASVSERINEERDYADGVTTSLAARYSRPVTKRGTLILSGSVSSAKLNAEHFSYDGLSLGATYSHKTEGGLAWSAGYSAALRDYDDIFTALTFARSDTSHTLSMSLAHDKVRIRDVVPRLSCYTKYQKSNVALYTYDTIDCSIGLKYDF
jgi:hypothetical protein